MAGQGSRHQLSLSDFASLFYCLSGLSVTTDIISDLNKVHTDSPAGVQKKEIENQENSGRKMIGWEPR